MPNLYSNNNREALAVVVTYTVGRAFTNGYNDTNRAPCVQILSMRCVPRPAALGLHVLLQSSAVRLLLDIVSHSGSVKDL